MPHLDTFGRPLRNLRISVTDRCNLRCQYCMPEKDYVWLPREQILQYEEIADLVEVFSELGVNKVRLTGGEPLVRRDLASLIRMLTTNTRISDLALTTNGVMLADQALELAQAGLHRITVSLDTLRPERFKALTRRDSHAAVLRGIDAAARASFRSLKIDAVVMRGTNEDEIADLIEYGKPLGAEVRFIEYMDVGGATLWSMDKVFTRQEMLQALEQRYGRIRPVVEESSAPAERFVLPDGAVFGIIASTTAPFCRSCDRSRLTADGLWYLCLYAKEGIDLRQAIRGRMPRHEIKALIASRWQQRMDRGAEERLALKDRRALAQKAELVRDPHLEMHTRGG